MEDYQAKLAEQRKDAASYNVYYSFDVSFGWVTAPTLFRGLIVEESRNLSTNGPHEFVKFTQTSNALLIAGFISFLIVDPVRECSHI